MSTRRNLNRLAYFVATLDAGSITAAAARLGVSKAVVSKQLQLLEAEVGTPLLLRNTRQMQPTDAGRAFFDAARAAVAQADLAFDAVLDRDSVPKGRLRITAPVDFGLSHVAPFVARYSDRYPAVEFDLHLGDETLDLIEDRFDLAFRVGWLTISSNLARKLQDFEEIPVCAPETLSSLSLEAPEDLRGLPFIASRAITDRRSWRFARGTEVRTIDLKSHSVMNITIAIRTAVMAGRGFTILPDFLVQDDLSEGRLVRLLPDWSLRKGGVYTVTAPGHVRSSALRTFLSLAHRELGRGSRREPR